MRDPSIHITLTEFTRIVEQLKIVDPGKAKQFSTDFFKHAHKARLSTRTVLLEKKNQTSVKIEKKVQAKAKASTKDTALFAQLITYVRRIEFKHRNVQKITSSSGKWDQLKEVVSLANQFSSDFKLDKPEAYKKYIRYICSNTKVFSLNRFPVYYEKFVAHTEAEVEILEDDNPSRTQEVYRIYQSIMIRNISFCAPYHEEPPKYIYFIRVRLLCEKNSWDAYHYINAQFVGLEFTGNPPDPSQLVGPKSIERYQKYMFNTHKKNSTEEAQAKGIRGMKFGEFLNK